MFYRLRRRIWHLWPKINVEYVYAHDLTHIPERSSKIPVEIFKLSLDNVHRILEVKKMPLKKLKIRLERGDLCYVTQHNGKLIAYQWVQFSGKHFIQQAGHTISVKSDDFWIYHARVLESYRSNGINSKIKSDLMKEAKKNGAKRALIYTNKNNIPNRKGLERLGFQLKEIIYSLESNKKFRQIFKKKIK